jgi:tetratricopeptide (TPR) repeat protein
MTYEETSLARRRVLHRRTADALATRARLRHDQGTLASQIAFHYQQSGQTGNAAEYFKLAGEHARALYANAEALAHFQAALTLGHPDTAELHEAIGDLQTLKGDYGTALIAYETAARLQGLVSASLEHKRGNLRHRRGEWGLAEEHFRAANAVEHSTKECARLFADWSLAVHYQGQRDRAWELAQRALALAQEAKDGQALAQVYNILGILANGAGDPDRAREHLEKSVAFAEALGEPEIRAAALNNLALTCRARGQVEHAIALTQTALDLCASVGDRHRVAALHSSLADLYHTLGHSDTAMAQLKQAISIFAEIGVDVGDWHPEIWKLVEW